MCTRMGRIKKNYLYTHATNVIMEPTYMIYAGFILLLQTLFARRFAKIENGVVVLTKKDRGSEYK